MVFMLSRLQMAKSGELAARIGHHLPDGATKPQRHDPYDVSKELNIT